MPWFDSFDAAVGRFAGMEILYDEPMALHTTFRIGGPAKRMARPRSTEEAAALLTLAEAEGWPVLTLGNGSNLLAADSGLDALVIHSGRLDALERTGERTIRAGAGVSLARLASFAQREGLGGLEFAHGIPGSLGGAVCMNAGAYGGEMRQVVQSVTAWFPGEGLRRLSGDEMAFGYRHSVFSGRRGAALEAELTLTIDIFAPRDGGAGACQEAAETLAENLVCHGAAGLNALELQAGDVEFLERDGLYRQKVTCRCRAWLVAETDGGGVFVDFEVKGRLR